VVECENIIINYGKGQGMGIKDKVDKTKVIWTENIIIRLRLDRCGVMRGRETAQHYSCCKTSTLDLATSRREVESSHAICCNMACRADTF
jgi:hypothetical protein